MNRAHAADRLDFFRTSAEFVPSAGRPGGRDPAGLVHLEPIEMESGEGLGVIFPSGFMTAIRCLELQAETPVRGAGGALRRRMQRLASQLHDGRCGYRFFRDSRRYPEDVDTTAFLNAALFVNGDLAGEARELARVRLLANRLAGGGFSVWLAPGAVDRAPVRDPVVDLNVFGSLALLSDGKAEFVDEFAHAVDEAIADCSVPGRGYYKNARFVHYLIALWSRLAGLRRFDAGLGLSLEDFDGQTVFQHRDGAIGYVLRYG